MTDPTPAEERWYRISDVVDLLDVHEQTVRRWLKSGELVGVNFHGRTGWRIKQHELDRFLRRKQLQSTVAAELVAAAES